MRFGGADVSAERRLADLENTLTLVKLDPEENVPLLTPLLDIPLTNDQTVPQAPEELRRRQLAALDDLGNCRCQGPAGSFGARRFALGGPDHARRAERDCRARRTSAAARLGDDAAGVSSIVEHALASRRDGTRPARSPRRCGT